MQGKKQNKIAEIYNSDLPHRAVSVWQYLNGRANNETGACFPAIGTIASELKLSRSTVKRAVNDLVAAGYVSKEQRLRERNCGQTSNLYTLL